MPKYQIGYWAKFDIGDPGKASNETLRKAVEKAGVAANRRLRSLEKAGFTGGMYKQAMADLGLPRKRFKEHAKSMSRGELLREYRNIRNFLSAQTSTPSGVRRANRKRYMTAVSRGFKGSEEEFYDLVDDYFNKNVEQLFSSNVIYDIITGENSDKKRSIVDAILSEQLSSRGAALLEYQERLASRR